MALSIFLSKNKIWMQSLQLGRYRKMYVPCPPELYFLEAYFCEAVQKAEKRLDESLLMFQNVLFHYEFAFYFRRYRSGALQISGRVKPVAAMGLFRLGFGLVRSRWCPPHDHDRGVGAA